MDPINDSQSNGRQSNHQGQTREKQAAVHIRTALSDTHLHSLYAALDSSPSRLLMCCALRRVSASSSEDQPAACTAAAAAGLFGGTSGKSAASSPKASEGGNAMPPPASLSQREARLQGRGAAARRAQPGLGCRTYRVQSIGCVPCVPAHSHKLFIIYFAARVLKAE